MNLSRRSSANDTSLIQSADESRSNDDGEMLMKTFDLSGKRFFLDDSDPNPKRRKTEEVNETLVGIPLNRGYERLISFLTKSIDFIQMETCDDRPCSYSNWCTW